MNRKVWLVVAQTLLGIGLLAAWFWVVDLNGIVAALRGVQLRYVLAAATLGIVSTALRATRWRQVLRAVQNLPWVEIWLVSLASSLINFVIPIRSGELARGLFLKQRHGVPVSATLPTVAVDRSLDLLAAVLIASVGAFSGLVRQGPLSVLLWGGASLLLVFAALVLLTTFRRGELLGSIDRLLPGSEASGLRIRIMGIISSLMVGFAAVAQQPRRLPPVFGLSLAASLLDASVFYLLFLSLGAVVPFMLVLIGYALFVITFVLPGAPGYIGSMEAFGSLVFVGLGVAESSAASSIVLFHALNASMLAVAGGLAIWSLGLRPGQVLRSLMQSSRARPAATAEAKISGEG